MPKLVITEREKGEIEEESEVVIVYEGVVPLVWENQNYLGDGNIMVFTLNPGEEESFPREHAKLIFGDWELPKAKKSEQKKWSVMIKDRIDRSPTYDGKLPMVKVYEQNGDLLWDAAAEFAQWFERHGVKMLPKPDVKGSGIKFEMPAILKDADGDTLKKLWVEAWGQKMPAGLSYDTARDILLAKLTPDQIADVLKGEFAVDPDMSQYEKRT